MNELHAIYERTLEIENEGGLMTADGTRRRTFGGTFFYLARTMLPKDISDAVFQTPWGKDYSKRQKQREQTMDWSNRADNLTRTNEKGTIEDMRVTLTGNPDEIVKDGTTVIVQMCHHFDYNHKQFPIGTPEAVLPPVVYAVYMAEKMWKKVQKDLAKPNRVLHINGVCHFDAETQTMAVLAEHVKTEKMKKPVKRGESEEQEQKPKAEKKKSEPALLKEEAQPANEVPALPVTPLVLPDGVPDDVAIKAQELHTAITKFEEKIANIKAKKQTSGLKMTERLLKNAETQLATLLKPYQ